VGRALTSLQDQAHRHLWMHFTRLGAFADGEIPVIERGEGCYVYDSHGRRFLDGLSGLFVVQVGHGRVALAEAAAEQASRLAYFPVWSFGHRPAIELAARLAALAPGGLDRVFFTVSGSEAVDAAWKLARQYFKATGEPGRYKIISRNLTYHGTSFGALAVTGLPGIKSPFEPMLAGGVRVQNTNHYRCIDCSALPACTLRCADDIEQRILMEGADTIAAVILEPLQNTGGAIAPPPGYFTQVRSICDKYGVLLVSDEVICAFGRLGYWFGCQRYDYQPDIITFAKGVTSGYAPLAGMIVSERLMSPFLSGGETFLHGHTFGGHPVSCAVALANLDLLESEDVLGNVRRHSDSFADVLDGLRDIPIVGDVRGDGYFRCVELVKDQATRQSFDAAECDWLLRDVLSPRLFELGLICRADDRAEPVIVLAPPLVAGPAEIEFIGTALRTALSEAWEAFRRR
jgi:adenosylmethionine-8-amino-7-oxononanoate aminotransferase